jgi:endonuclease/exonuclease/phosphatase (EEP) superfamily protein YafD
MRKTLAFLFFSLLVSVSGFVQAQVTDAASTPILLLREFPGGQADALPQRFEILVWNIQKAGNEKMPDDFAQLAAGAELALFQEAIDKPAWVNAIGFAKPDFGWSLAQSFQSGWLGYSTGVATGSRVRPLRQRAALSPVAEPVTMTPKSILVTEYSLAARADTLLVANVHAINFREQGAFESHMNQLIELVQSHVGPLIVAGDFNTWAPSRQAFLVSRLAALGMTEVPLERTGFLVLDHVFTRGLAARETVSHFDIQTSDHYPLTIDVSVTH